MISLHPFPSRVGHILAGLVLGCAMPPAVAEPAVSPEADTRWLCWDNRDTTLRCRLAAAPQDAAGATDAPMPPDRRTDLYPRRGPLPPIVGVIRDNPGRLRGNTITIPMFSDPVEMAFAEQLARAVMCAGRPSCEVEFARSPGAVALLGDDDPALD